MLKQTAIQTFLNNKQLYINIIVYLYTAIGTEILYNRV